MIKIISFLFFILSSSLFAQINVREIPADIKTIESFGYWQNDNDDGNYRLIVTTSGFEHVKNLAFIQLLKNNSEEGFSVIDSFPIEEINQSECFIISDFQIAEENKSYTIKFNLLNTYSLETSNLFIKINLNSYQLINK